MVGRVSICVCVVGGEFSFTLSPSSDTCSTVLRTGLGGALPGISRFYKQNEGQTGYNMVSSKLTFLI